jgi:hypothetical protein
VLTLHKNLALTSALHELQCGPVARLIGWHHDFAWERPDYRSESLGDPWTCCAGRGQVAQVVVSAAQRLIG